MEDGWAIRRCFSPMGLGWIGLDWIAGPRVLIMAVNAAAAAAGKDGIDGSALPYLAA